jgi:hypothetical protein
LRSPSLTTMVSPGWPSAGRPQHQSHPAAEGSDKPVRNYDDKSMRRLTSALVSEVPDDKKDEKLRRRHHPLMPGRLPAVL